MSPLAGHRVLITRPRERAAAMVSLLEQRGATSLLLPAIATVPPEDPGALRDAITRVATYTWIVFTSAAAVDAVCDVLAGRALPGNVRVAAVGPATADALGARRLTVHAMPAVFRGEEIAAAIGNCSGERMLVPRSDIARPETVAALRGRGAVVDEVVAYRTVTASTGVNSADQVVRSADHITFTSPSGVRGLAALLDETLADVTAHATIACIGPATSSAVRDLGLVVHVEPPEHTIPGLLAALEEYVRSGTAVRAVQ